MSGIQPTGTIHLGNYLGALVSWVRMQRDWADAAPDALVFSIVDLHAMTNLRRADPAGVSLHQATMHTATALLACGLQPERCVLFRQSDVGEHAQLAWLLSCVAPMGALSRMTQFKDKRASGSAEVLGLFSYPVLQTADVMLYRATHVPVGEDQRQHIELARDLIERFNERFGTQVPLPQLVLSPAAPRVMALTDGTRKMSKSDPDDRTRINLLDSPDTVSAKIRRAATDAVRGISYEPDARPNVANLVAIGAALEQTSPAAFAARFESSSTASFKAALAECIIAHLAPVRERYAALQADPGYVAATLERGAATARRLAQQTYGETLAAVLDSRA